MLRFDSHGKFRILVLADIQDRRVLNDSKQAHLSGLIAQAAPQLVVLLGDAIFGPGILTKQRARQVISSIVSPLDRACVPFVFVAGNHDLDGRITLEEQVEAYRESRFCLTPRISDRECKEAYVLDIHANDAQNNSVTLLFLDSGATRFTWTGIDYDPAQTGQLAFSSSVLSRQDCQSAYVFQHIPVPEVFKLVKEVPALTPGAVHGHGPDRFKHYVLADSAVGSLGEVPCPPRQNAGQFDGWLQSRKVKAAFFGHDHKNSFLGSVEGISLIHTACAGLSCYGSDELRGGRLAVISSDGGFHTEPLFYKLLNVT